MGDQTVHEDSNNVTHFKYKYELSYKNLPSQN